MILPKPKDWTRFRRGLCNNCRASCCHSLPVEASVPDMLRLGLLTAEEASGPLVGPAKRLQKRGIIKRYRPRTMIFVLQQKQNGDCLFLNRERRCQVYEKRPTICREFPKIGPRPGFCPYLPKPPTRKL